MSERLVKENLGIFRQRQICKRIGYLEFKQRVILQFMEQKYIEQNRKKVMNSDDQNSIGAAPQPNQDKTFDFNELIVPQPSSISGIAEEPSPYDKIYFIDEPHRRVSCVDCKKEVSRTVCMLFRDEFRCVGCFAKLQVGDETYTVVKSLAYSVIDLNWKAHHEILFLTLLEKFGFGNWKEIKEELEYFGAKYSEEELETHYYAYYLSQEDYLPKFASNEPFFQKRCEPISISKVSVVNNPTSISSLATNAHREEDNHYQFEEIEDYYANNFTAKDGKFIEYFNEKRNEFEVQYDHDAELLLANLEFRDDDCEEQRRIKFKIIGEYNRRLEKRNKIKEFVLEHRLLEESYQKEMDKSRNEYERDAFEQLKPLARFTTLKEYNELVRKVAFTKQLKSTIQGLRRLRRAHPSSYKNLDEFLNTQPEQSKPRRKNPNDHGIKTGKKVEQILEKQFKLNKRDFQNLFQNLQADGQWATYKNVQAVKFLKKY